MRTPENSHKLTVAGDTSPHHSAVSREYSEKLQQALFEISEQAHSLSSEEELYSSLREIIGRFINARNFLIALRQERDSRQYIKFVYYYDEFDAYLQGLEFEVDPEAKHTMSGYLLHSGKPLLLVPEIFDEFCRENNISPLGTKAYSLVGAPFYLEHLAGVVLVQSYSEYLYTDKDKDLMAYVARHIGDALQRKKAIDDIRDANEIFSLFLRYSPVHVYIKEVSKGESRIVKVSDNYSASLNKSSEDVIGKNMAELFPPDFAAKTTRDDIEVVNSGVPLQTEDFLDGRTYSTIKFPIHRGGKSLLAGYSIDITGLIRHEKEQQKIEKLESLGVLAGGIAHDFNNILTGIMGNLSFSQALIGAGHRAHKPLAEAEKATRRAAELAQQLLTFAKGGEPNKKVISLQRQVHEAVSLMLRGSNIRPVLNVPPTLQAIRADEGQISQVLNNLIINASQAMPGGGILTITGSNEIVPEDNPFNINAGPYTRLCVQDTGCGISPDDLPKIFDPYFSTKISGTGLGLASAYSIIQRHKGHISAASTVGAGTTFTILLPSIGAQSEEMVLVPEKTAKTSSGGSILVMDDEEMIRDIATQMLGFLGYEVTTCADGARAIELYQASLQSQKTYAAVIMDLTIPGGLGGKDAAEHILAVDSSAHLIVSSGYSSDPVIANFRQYGFSGAIAKPYNLDEFKKVLSSVPARIAEELQRPTPPAARGARRNDPSHQN